MKKQGIWIALILILVVLTTCASATGSSVLTISPMNEGQAVLLSPDNIRIEIVSIDSFYVRINVTSSSNRIGDTRTIGTGDTGDFLTPIETSSRSIDRIALALYGDSVGLTLYSNSELRIVDYIDSVEEKASTVPVPDLKLKKYLDKASIQVGESAIISVELKNRGNGSATSIDLDELMMPDGITIDGTLPDTSDVTIAPDQTRTFQYKIKATKEGNYTIPPTTVYYKSETNVNYEGTTNSLPLTVAKPPELKPLLETDIEIGNLRLYTGEETTVQITITNNGDAPANNVKITGIVDGTPKDGVEYMNEDFEGSFKIIAPGDSETYLFEPIIKARDVGSYVIKLEIDYDGGSTDAISQKIRVIKKEYRIEDFYKYAPILIIPVLLILLVFGIQFVKRYMAYRY